MANNTSTCEDKRRKWQHDDNKELISCWLLSNPDQRGFRKRLLNVWNQRNPDRPASEQLLAGQVRAVLQRKEFSDLEIEEMRQVLGKSNVIHDQSIQEHWSVEGNVNVESTNGSGVDGEANGSDMSDLSLPDSSQIPTELRSLFDKLKAYTQQLSVPNDVILPCLRAVPRNKLMKTVSQINELCKFFQTSNLQATIDLMFAAARVSVEELGMSCRSSSVGCNVQLPSMPPWKRRLTSKLQWFRRDLGRLMSLDRGQLHTQDTINYLHNKYLMNGTPLPVAIETLKQKILACSNKIQRYTNRSEGFHQNKLFRVNQRRFYQSLVDPEDHTNQSSNYPSTFTNQVVQFWRDLWEDDKHHNTQALWISRVADKLQGINNQETLEITQEKVAAAAKRSKNWRAAGLDGIHNFWIKYLTNLHERLASQIQDILNGSDIPSWLTQGRTVLIMKNKDVGPTVVSNYRPITCLSNIWKLITSIIADEILAHLDTHNSWPWEQKGCKRRSKGTKDHLLVDKLVMFLTKRNRRNLRISWIDYRKAYDSVPHSWIFEVLRMYKVADNVCSFLKASISLWKTALTLNGKLLGYVNIKRGIFQGDSLSPLLFVMCLFPLSSLLRDLQKGFTIDGTVISHLLYLDDLKLYSKSEEDMVTLVNTVRIFSDDIRMNFGFSKCANLAVKRGKVIECADINLPGGTIGALSFSASYKYLGVLESAEFKHTQVKLSVTTTYKHRLRKILQSHLSGHNQIVAINSFAVPVLRYTAGIINWTVNECAELDRLTRKQMTLFKALHPKADVDRLYVPRRRGGRGLLSILDVVRLEKGALLTYTTRAEEPVLRKVKQHLMSLDSWTSVTKSSIVDQHVESWRNKPLHGQWPNLMLERSNNSSRWLRTAHLKPVTEALITAAQDQALSTNWLECHIFKIRSSDLCRKCGQFPESIEHIVAGCPLMAQTVYLARHNAITSAIHWCLCGSYGFQRSDRWWQHKPEPVLENDSFKILYDFNIFTDTRISARRPDLVLVDKEAKHSFLIDVACVMDRNVVSKENEKVDKYLDLSIELQRIWNTRVEVVPVIIGALGSISSSIYTSLATLRVTEIDVHQLQKTVLLRTATILRRHFNLPSSS